MHGSPCAYHGGSDLRCPPNSVPGLWWRYTIPKVGTVYYVDCCGHTITHTKVCAWTKEPNWCGGLGKNIYTCTLAVLHHQLQLGSDGFPDPKVHGYLKKP